MTPWTPEVKRAHVALLHYIWIERLPELLGHCGFSLNDAWATWARFMENPADPKLAGVKRVVNDEFLRLVQSN